MYAKIFEQIYDGTLCSRGPWQALVTFQQLLILADSDGCVDMTPIAISRRTTIPIDVIEQGLSALILPDPDSRTPDEEGKRIIPLSENRSWGWRIVNYVHYRNLRDEESRRAYHRNYWHKRKEKLNTTQQYSTDSTNAVSSKQYAVSSKQESQNTNVETDANKTSVSPPADPVPYEQIRELYHRMLPELPRCVKLSESRKAMIRARWREDLPALSNWENYFSIVKRSSFLMGKKNGSNGRAPFRATLAWLCKEENALKTCEGQYVDR